MGNPKKKHIYDPTDHKGSAFAKKNDNKELIKNINQSIPQFLYLGSFSS